MTKASGARSPSNSKSDNRADRLAERRRRQKTKVAVLSVIVFAVTAGALVMHAATSPSSTRKDSGALVGSESGRGVATSPSKPAYSGAPSTQSSKHRARSDAAAIGNESQPVGATFDGHACSLLRVDDVAPISGQQLSARPSGAGSNGCWYSHDTRIVVSITVNRGLSGGPATQDDLNRLTAGISPSTQVSDLGDSAILVGHEPTTVLFVLAKGWTVEIAADSASVEQQLAQTAIARL